MTSHLFTRLPVAATNSSRSSTGRYGTTNRRSRGHLRQVGPKVTIQAEHVKRFCSVVDNQGESIATSRIKEAQMPTSSQLLLNDSSYIRCFPVMLMATRSTLVHLSKFQRFPHARWRGASCDMCEDESCIMTLYRRGRVTDHENIFHITKESDYLVLFITDTEVGVTQLKGSSLRALAHLPHPVSGVVHGQDGHIC
ncbi:hypothetical protein D9619_004591 [Psilocybe cf. subviscida]|uniref:Uncharacterized protein n=1 Tax=Psilocybe cf. subviscida TaxID=2480587 RepID=A0A8H5F8W7_9AGAR|nr:hypothetical protein D9619_004591 [Psilocybe cf. subviscida]